MTTNWSDSKWRSSDLIIVVSRLGLKYRSNMGRTIHSDESPTAPLFLWCGLFLWLDQKHEHSRIPELIKKKSFPSSIPESFRDLSILMDLVLRSNHLVRKLDAIFVKLVSELGAFFAAGWASTNPSLVMTSQQLRMALGHHEACALCPWTRCWMIYAEMHSWATFPSVDRVLGAASMAENPRLSFLSISKIITQCCAAENLNKTWVLVVFLTHHRFWLNWLCSQVVDSP